MCAPKIIFFNENYFQQDSDNFRRRKLTLKVKILQTAGDPGALVAFKTWWGHQYMVGIICPLSWNRTKVADITWWGPVPMSPCTQARLYLT